MYVTVIVKENLIFLEPFIAQLNLQAPFGQNFDFKLRKKSRKNFPTNAAFMRQKAIGACLSQVTSKKLTKKRN